MVLGVLRGCRCGGNTSVPVQSTRGQIGTDPNAAHGERRSDSLAIAFFPTAVLFKHNTHMYTHARYGCSHTHTHAHMHTHTQTHRHTSTLFESASPINTRHSNVSTDEIQSLTLMGTETLMMEQNFANYLIPVNLTVVSFCSPCTIGDTLTKWLLCDVIFCC